MTPTEFNRAKYLRVIVSYKVFMSYAGPVE